MKIGFLAMSRLRAHDAKLLKLGLSLPGVAERGRVLSCLPSLGLLYLAACTPPGHELHYFEAEGDGGNRARSIRLRPGGHQHVLGPGFRGLRRGRSAAQAGVRVAMGGLHVYGPAGRGARARRLCFSRRRRKNLAGRRAGHRPGNARRVWNSADFPPLDIRSLPVPRYDLLGKRPYSRFPVQTTRGCPWRCDFCASNVMLNEPYRKRPVAEVVRDIQAVRRLHKRTLHRVRGRQHLRRSCLGQRAVPGH